MSPSDSSSLHRQPLPARVTVLGAGAMGTACAILLADRPELDIRLWVRRPADAARLHADRVNARLLPGIPLPPRIFVTSDIAAAIADTQLLVVSIPTPFLRESLTPLATRLPPNLLVVSVAKGLEQQTFLRPSQIIAQSLPHPRVVALCGPSHAEEFARRLPTSVVAASPDLDLAAQVQALFTTDRFRVYTNRDLLGVELAGALKNVVAIAAGICDGLGYGDNAKSALLTRGIVEMARFGKQLGADLETFAGLAGIGDLMTTCFSPYGRNRRVGRELGEGRSLHDALAGIEGHVEGVPTCRSVYHFARSRGVDLPIITEVYRVLFEGKSPTAATDSLMLRPPRSES